MAVYGTVMAHSSLLAAAVIYILATYGFVPSRELTVLAALVPAAVPLGSELGQAVVDRRVIRLEDAREDPLPRRGQLVQTVVGGRAAVVGVLGARWIGLFRAGRL